MEVFRNGFGGGAGWKDWEGWQAGGANAAAERTKADCNSGSGKRGEARARDWQWLPKVLTGEEM